MTNSPLHSINLQQPLIIWSVSDGKPGHAAQSRGLIEAIGRRLDESVSVQIQQVPVTSTARAWRDWLLRRTALGRDLPDPHLIVGVGHSTHPAMLAIRAARGGRAIVLMQPSLPLGMFDLAIIPAHDTPKARSNVIVTRGVLNQIHPASHQNPTSGLILLGGPSRHADWNDDAIAAQVHMIVTEAADTSWLLTTSRRTPPTTAAHMQKLNLPNLSITPGHETPAGWVADQLDQCGQVWVSADSVSMVYEALTSGARVGILHVPQRRVNRVGAGLNDLMKDGFVTSFDQWKQTQQLKPAPSQLWEADRCAAMIVQQWLPAWGLLAHESS